MSLNIKNEHVHDLARQAAVVTGKSLTGAIEEALTRLLSAYDIDPGQQRRQARIDVARGIAADYAADPGRDVRGVRRVEDLYDDSTGLPR